MKALGADNFDYASEVPDENNKNPGNVAGGLKAYVSGLLVALGMAQAWNTGRILTVFYCRAINNPQISDEGKDSAKKQLDNM